MAVTPDIRSTQGMVLAGVRISASGIRYTQAQGLAAINFPTDSQRLTNATVQGAIVPDTNTDITQVFVLAAVKGRIANQKIRAWTFSLDGHDFYVIRLDDTETLVYDMSTEQWHKWSSPEENFWRVWNGMNWLGMSRATFLSGAKTQIVAGDDVHGLLWTINPDQGTDDHPRDGAATPMVFERKIVGGIAMRLRETQSVGAAYLIASNGSPQTLGTDITLRTSDDYGKTWADHGTVTVEVGDYSKELVWRSIGLIKSPGRIFELTDSGATVRIDSLDIR